MENKEIEEIINLRKEFLSSVEVAAVLGIATCTFRKKAEEYAEFFPIQRVGKKYRIPKAPFVAYVRTGKSFKWGEVQDGCKDSGQTTGVLAKNVDGEIFSSAE